MNDGSIIPYVDTCNHLGNTINIKSDKVILDNAVNELYMRTNCLLSDSSFSECSTLSHLFNTYCMNIYGSPLWKYSDKNHCEGSGRFQMLHIITYYLSYIIAIQLT